MPQTQLPGLFGLNNSNRDFSQAEYWGKNQFSSSFPVSLCCYLASKNIPAVYIKLDRANIVRGGISLDNVFGASLTDPEIFFSFETQYLLFAKYIVGRMPGVDLVVLKKDKFLIGLEIKLTALPDYITCGLKESDYGSELVVRPDTIAYLAWTIAESSDISSLPDVGIANTDYQHAIKVLEKTKMIIDAVRVIGQASEAKQSPFLIQPVWKTLGKTAHLADNCLDVFVWSNSAFISYICREANSDINATKIDRTTRTVVWLYKMLLDIKLKGRFNHEMIIDEMSFNTKNDKAFALNGAINNKYMKCERLEKPIITKGEIKKIILGGGQNLLSPERRFDSILVSSPDLFQ